MTKGHAAVVKSVVVLMLLGLADATFAEYNEALSILFFGRQPSARAEALGKSYVAIGGDASCVFYNPAGIARVAGLSLNLTHSSPYYLLDEADYYFAGGVYRFTKLAVISTSVYHIDYNQPTVEYDELGQAVRRFTPKISLYSVTWASEPISNYFAGLNASLLHSNLHESNAFLLDVGVLKVFDLKKIGRFEHEVSVGASLSNITSSSIKGDELPVTFRFGVAYNFTVSGSLFLHGLNPVEVLTTLEYQDLLNSDYRSGIKMGGELSFFELLSIRLGYYKEKVNDYGFTNVNKSSIDDITYGLGINLPLRRLGLVRIPINVSIDAVRLTQPTYVKIYDDWEKFSVYSLRFQLAY